MHDGFWPLTAIFFGYYLVLTLLDLALLSFGFGGAPVLAGYLLWSVAVAAAAALWWASVYREHPVAVLPRSAGYLVWLMGAFFIAFGALQLAPRGAGTTVALLGGGAWLLVTLPLPARVLHLGPGVDRDSLVLDVGARWRAGLIFLVVAALVVVVADHLGTRIARFFASALPGLLVPWVAALLTSMGWALVAPRLFQWHQEVVSGTYRWR